MRVAGDELVVTHAGADGAREVARHRLTTPGNPRIDPAHYPERSSDPLHPRARPQTPEERAFCELGAGAERWLIAAAAAGVQRIRTKMVRATDLAALVGPEAVERALAAAAAAGRFDDGDLESILDHLQNRGALAARLPVAEATLQPGTGAWEVLRR